MPEFTIPYGHSTQSFFLPAEVSIDWIEPAPIAPAADPLRVVKEAIAHPVDGVLLESYQGAGTVAIAVNDKTRPVPHEHLLPPLLDALNAAGFADEAITFLIATGTHLPMPPESFARVLPGDIIKRCRVLSHNCDDTTNLVSLGATTRGTQIFANRKFMEAGLRIVVGNIEPHHFAGFSGGYKSAAIGLAGRETINYNHAMLVEPDSRIAEFARNPLRQDIEEIGDALGVHFALNAILNGEKKIVRALSGAPRSVMAAGIPISQEICQVTAPKPGRAYDLVIASVGGAPKDINFYQSQKAITHASLLARDGGVIILAAECPEGSGSRAYEEFMQGVTSPAQVFEKFRATGFRVGPHKAFQVARDAARVRIILVSSIPAALVSGLLMTPAESVQAACSQALDWISPSPAGTQIAILPRATNTVPIF